MVEENPRHATAQHLPRHVAIIMDGNGRWAKQRNLPRFAGHKAGVESVRSTISCCLDLGIEVLSLFAFSSENWRRPKEEVGLLMNLFMHVLDNEVKRLHRSGVRLRIIGEIEAFSPALQQRIHNAEALTRENTQMTLCVAANYGGRWDIARAARRLAEQVVAGRLDPGDIDSERLAAELCITDLPAPDLFIRTGGEQRISNFLLWQLAYSELYFTDLSWPDFDRAAFLDSLDSYANRERRFGRTSEQVRGE